MKVLEDFHVKLRVQSDKGREVNNIAKDIAVENLKVFFRGGYNGSVCGACRGF